MQVSPILLLAGLMTLACCFCGGAADVLGYGLTGARLFQFNSSYACAELLDTQNGWSVASLQGQNNLLHVLTVSTSGGINVQGLNIYKRTGDESMQLALTLPLSTGFPQRGSPKISASQHWIWLHADLHFWRINPVTGVMQLWGDDQNCGSPGAPLDDEHYVWFDNCNSSIAVTGSNGVTREFPLPAEFAPNLAWDVSVSPKGILGMVLNVGFENALVAQGSLMTMPWPSSAYYMAIREKIGVGNAIFHDGSASFFVTHGMDGIDVMTPGSSQLVLAVDHMVNTFTLVQM